MEAKVSFPAISPDEAVARLALYFGIPFMAVMFFYSIYQFIQWIKVGATIAGGAVHAALVVANLARTQIGFIFQTIVSHLLVIISGTYVAQCAQYEFGIKYEGDAELRDFQYPLELDDFLQMLTALKPFDYTGEIFAVLLILSILSIIDLVFDRAASWIPGMIVGVIIYLTAIHMSCYLFVSLVSGIVGLMYFASGDDFSGWAEFTVYSLMGTSGLPAVWSYYWIYVLHADRAEGRDKRRNDDLKARLHRWDNEGGRK